MKKIKPAEFKQILAKLYAIYASDYDNNDSRYDHIIIDGVMYKVGYIIGNTNKEPINIRIVRKSDL